MKAIVVHGEKDAPVLMWEEVADLVAGPGELLIDVKATAVNRADLAQARGNYPPPPGASEILGLEMSGVVAGVGNDVDEWQVGDRACALLPGGGYAEQVVVPAGMLMRIPDDWSHVDAAAIPEVWMTAYLNLFMEGGLQEGETALIHAGASGVGTAAIQLVTAAGCRAFVTAGSDEKLERCRELGAVLAVNRKTGDFLTAVLEETDGAGVDVILDPVGAAYLEHNIKALARFGRLIHIGLLSGSRAELDLGQVMGKRLMLKGSTLRTRSLPEKIDITRRLERDVWPQLIAGTFLPIVDRVFPIEEAQAAHQYVVDDLNVGKVILQVAAE